MLSDPIPNRSQATWQTSGWQAEATAWLAGELGLTSTDIGPLETIHQTPWSMVASSTAPGGPLYLKVVADAFRHEMALTVTICERAPGISPEVLAVDQSRGWLLMRGAGQRLREAAHGEALIRHWQALLPRYAELQSSWQLGAEELYHMGVPDRSLWRLANELPELIETAIRGGEGLQEGLQAEEVEQLSAIEPALLERLASLAESGVSESIDHGDLHDANVFIKKEEYAIIDWGDAGISFPFFSLRTVEVSLENRLGESALPSARDGLRRAYLGPWMDVTGLTESAARNLLETAERVWALAAASRWRRAISLLPDRERREYGYVLPSLFREVLQASGR